MTGTGARWCGLAACALLLLLAGSAAAQNLATPDPDRAAVALGASASMAVDNDRMDVVLQAMAEHRSAAAAANEVNGKMSAALAKAKTVAGLTAKTSGYGTERVYEPRSVSGPARPTGWRVTQTLVIEATSFAAAAGLAGTLQEDGLQLLSLGFRVSPEARRKVETQLQHEALKAWQERAAAAAASMGYAGYRPGRLSVGHHGVPMPRQHMAEQAMMKSSVDVAPVSVAGGTSEIAVTVSGEAILVGNRK
jgi:predicted secreted protein